MFTYDISSNTYNNFLRKVEVFLETKYLLMDNWVWSVILEAIII